MNAGESLYGNPAEAWIPSDPARKHCGTRGATVAGMDTRLGWIIPAFVFAACHRAVPPKPPPPKVEVATVMQIDIQIRRQWVATLDGLVNADIRPQVEGYVREQVYLD